MSITHTQVQPSARAIRARRRQEKKTLATGAAEEAGRERDYDAVGCDSVFLIVVYVALAVLTLACNTYNPNVSARLARVDGDVSWLWAPSPSPSPSPSPLPLPLQAFSRVVKMLVGPMLGA